MKVAFEDIGRMAATFAVNGGIAGHVCRMAANGVVGGCIEGEDFIGVMEGIRNGCCAVQLHGFAEVAYTGTAPALGYVKLVANGGGGVKADENGREHLVVCVDENAMKAIIEL